MKFTNDDNYLLEEKADHFVLTEKVYKLDLRGNIILLVLIMIWVILLSNGHIGWSLLLLICISGVIYENYKQSQYILSKNSILMKTISFGKEMKSIDYNIDSINHAYIEDQYQGYSKSLYAVNIVRNNKPVELMSLRYEENALAVMNFINDTIKEKQVKIIEESLQKNKVSDR